MADYTNLQKRLVARRLLLAILFLIPLFFSTGLHPAQSQVTYPIYIVEYGDTLSWIAQRFDTTLDQLMTLNNIQPDDMLRPGDRLQIPSLEGMQGVLTTEYVTLGSSLTSLSRRSQTDTAVLVKANQLTSPSELFIGREIIMTIQEDGSYMSTMPAIKPGQSFLEASVLSGKNTWLLAGMNGLASPTMGMPMDTYYMPSTEENGSNLALPGIKSIILDNLPLTQGDTFLIEVESDQPVTVQADLASIQPAFVDLGGVQMAYGGINAMTEPGVYPLTMTVTYPDGSEYRFDQLVMISSGGFLIDKPLQVDPESIGTEAENAENAKFKSIVLPVTPVQQWGGLWTSPTQDPDNIISHFGSRRTYNDDPGVYYHTGLDLGYQKGTDVYAPAGGTVVGVFPDQVVRGNSIVIDHGLGVYTIYMHLNDILVEQGAIVESGQLIGIIGTTGRSTGPHLHFEVDIQGTPVNPLTWLRREFP
jgi:LysM repeat protein/biotin carboxyl carrier protein